VQKTAFCFIQSATTGFTANVFPYRICVSPKEAFEGPEPDDGKLSRPVLRGPGSRKAVWLLGELHDLEIDRTSCSSFWANQFRVLLTAAAYVLMQELRLRAAGTACARSQVLILRERLLKLGLGSWSRYGACSFTCLRRFRFYPPSVLSPAVWALRAHKSPLPQIPGEPCHALRTSVSPRAKIHLRA
jgi:hypothetical protein